MTETIDAYGLIGDGRTAALVSANGRLGWLCWPDFDSQACFASLIGTDANGFWTVAPKSSRTSTRRYLPGTIILETTFKQTFGAAVTVTDFMPVSSEHSSVVRIVRGVKGRTRMHTCFAPRFDYGNVQPRIRKQEKGRWSVVNGPHRLVLRSNVALQLDKGDLRAEWIAKKDETYFFTLQHSISYRKPEPPPVNAEQAQQETHAYWTKWISRSTYKGPYKRAVERSLLTLQALTSVDSGGFVAAATTSLPEKVRGIRNWDYRFCWLRDTTFGLLGLMHCGYREDTKAWLEWLSRSLQGNPDALKTLYGVTGKREHSEWEADWLPGYKDSKPVHIGNKASGQLQLDTFGEVLDALYRARCQGCYPVEDQSGDALELPLLEHLEKIWDDPDDGFWEVRSGRQQFTQSKVMAWVAFDRGIRIAKRFGMKGPVERWRKIRKKIHAQVCDRGFHRRMNSFTQAYGTKHLDSSLLLLPLVGFLPIKDPRVMGTVKAIEKHLMREGLLLRYDTARVDDGLPAGEGAFLACNFWLVDVYVLQGRRDEARAYFEKLLALSNDLNLLSEEYDPKHGLIGNFPQAFSHIGLIEAAITLEVGTSIRLYDLD
ncbi:MAG: glycoside hydrolase family 15 protein [Candidatus Acidiferrales bacterium]